MQFSKYFNIHSVQMNATTKINLKLLSFLKILHCKQQTNLIFNVI